MYFISALIFCLSLTTVFAKNCEDISGIWRNQLGSNMTIIQTSQNRFTGEYITAVESKLRASLVTSNLTGIHMPVEGGVLISFSVLFNHGKSLTTWVGQCMVCDGEEVLFTTWSLRNHFLKPTDRWMSMRIHHDTFKRMDGGFTTIPSHLRGPSRKDKKSYNCEKDINVGLNGMWVSEKDDVLRFTDCFESGILTGFNRDSALFGRTGGGGPFTAFGFVSASDENIKGWTGHIYDSTMEKRRMETTWLSHGFSNSCKDPTSLVRFGVDNYVFTYGYEVAEKKEVKVPIWRQGFNYLTSMFL